MNQSTISLTLGNPENWHETKGINNFSEALFSENIDTTRVIGQIVPSHFLACCCNTCHYIEYFLTFKVISSLIRLPDYMDELIAIPVEALKRSYRVSVTQLRTCVNGFRRCTKIINNLKSRNHDVLWKRAGKIFLD
jgi:hypothetical protein